MEQQQVFSVSPHYFIRKVLTVIEPGKSMSSLPVMSPFPDLHLAATPWVSSSGTVVDRYPGLWPTPSYHAYSVTVKYVLSKDGKPTVSVKAQLVEA